jgi:hypothetical protein
MDQQKVRFSNRILAVLVSLIAAITLIISQFTFPLELVLFNGQSYLPVIENEDLTGRYPEIITNMLISQLYDGKVAGGLPDIFSNRDAFQSVLSNFVPAEWSKETMLDFIDQIMDYLNFRLPTNAMNIEIGGLKSELFLNSQNIADNYINALVNCSENAFRDLGLEATVFELPPCKPDRSRMPRYIEITSSYLEDLFNQLPSRFSIAKATTINNSSTNRFFYAYSIGRWALRLLPLLTLTLLILIAVLLKRERSVMLRWIGRLLVFTSAFTLILLVIVLIGFDQMIALIVNRFLGNLIEGFDVLLLGFIQEVGYQTIVWVIVSVIVTLGFGLFLFLMANVLKPKKKDTDLGSSNVDVPLENEQTPVKDIAPQTIEEIEEEESKQSEEEN